MYRFLCHLRSGASAGKPALGRKRSKSKEDSPDYVPHANKKRRDGEPVRLGKVTDFSAAAKPKVEGVEPTVDASTSDPSDQVRTYYTRQSSLQGQSLDMFRSQ